MEFAIPENDERIVATPKKYSKLKGIRKNGPVHSLSILQMAAYSSRRLVQSMHSNPRQSWKTESL
jgi:hypothetical protein